MADPSPDEVCSPAWRAELARRLEGAPPAGGRRIALGQVVTGLSGGDVAWTVLVGGGEVARVVEGVAGAEVCLVTDGEAARQLLTGTPPARLASEGRLKVRGKAAALVEAYEALSLLGRAVASEEPA